MSGQQPRAGDGQRAAAAAGLHAAAPPAGARLCTPHSGPWAPQGAWKSVEFAPPDPRPPCTSFSPAAESRLFCCLLVSLDLVTSPTSPQSPHTHYG